MWSTEKQASRKLWRGVLLLHDNVPSHTSAVVTSAAADCGYELLLHPPYLPDLAPSDFCLFPLLKQDFSGTHFSSENDVIASMEVFLRGQDKLFYKAGIQKLQKRWNNIALKLAEIMWKNKLVTVVVFCFFVYEAGNLWNNSRILNTLLVFVIMATL